jgi:hypothetical protein
LGFDVPKKKRRHHLDRRASQIIEDAPPLSQPDKLLSAKQIADWFGISKKKLETDRRLTRRGTPTGPPFVAISLRVMRYPQGDALAWLKSRTRGKGGAR